MDTEPFESVTHVVLVSWRATVDDATIAAIRQVARALPAAIPGILHISEGPSVSPEGLEGDYDYALVIRFTDAAHRDAYLPHPAHLPLAKSLGEHSERLVVFDVAG